MRHVAIALVLLTVTASLAYAEAGKRVSERTSVPMSAVVVNDCTGEQIQLDGTMHVQYNARETPEGFRAEAMSNYQGVSGVGQTTGRKYHMVGAGNSNVDFRRPYPAHSSTVNSVRLISQGGAPDSHYRVHWRYTMNADGRLTAEFDRAEVECRGGRR